MFCAWFSAAGLVLAIESEPLSHLPLFVPAFSTRMDSSADPHHLLGLEPGATAAEIKRAFRRLAMHWHPDRNRDPQAVEHFKLVRAAYEQLLAGLETVQAAVEAQPAPRSRAADRHQTLEITIEEAFCGATREVWVGRAQPCEDCLGTGWLTLAHGRLCGECHGSGRVRRACGLERCAACEGRGYRHRVECEQCQGSGRRLESQAYSLQVPAGSEDGVVLRLGGAGEPAGEGQQPGDLLVTLRIAPHPLFRTEGRDVLLQRPIGALRMLLGGEILLPHPSGTRRFELPAGPISAREIRLPGAGWPARGNKPAGDLRVMLQPVMPRALDPALLAPLVAAIEADPALYQPVVDAWERQWLSDAGSAAA